jgi:hypothetical protein
MTLSFGSTPAGLQSLNTGPNSRNLIRTHFDASVSLIWTGFGRRRGLSKSGYSDRFLRLLRQDRRLLTLLEQHFHPCRDPGSVTGLVEEAAR